MLQVGDIVAQHLRLERQLGSGGMGSVWVAEHLRLGGRVAVKFLSLNLLDHPGARARFDKEARWVAKIRSPHVVQVHDHGVTEDERPVPFIVMELLEGEDLATRIEREGPLPLPQAAEVLDQVCDALTKAHEVGIVHRDVKPENVFLVTNKRIFIKLLDFGVAHANDGQIDRLTQTGLLLGTAHYMSPEQLFSGKDIDHRADLWALGVLAYQMLTARLPFHGETFGSLCLQVRDGQFPPASQWAAVPPILDAWFDKALAIDRNKRFQSAAEMGAAFQQALATALSDGGRLSGGTVAVSSAAMQSAVRSAQASSPALGYAAHAPSSPGAGPTQASAGTGGSSGGFSSGGSAGISSAANSFGSGSGFGSTLSTDAQGALSLKTDPGAEAYGAPKNRPSRVWLGGLAALAVLAVGIGVVRVLTSGSAPTDNPPIAAQSAAADRAAADSTNAEQALGANKLEAVPDSPGAATAPAVSPSAAVSGLSAASAVSEVGEPPQTATDAPSDGNPSGAPNTGRPSTAIQARTKVAAAAQKPAVSGTGAVKAKDRASLVEESHAATKPVPAVPANKNRGF